MSRAEAEARLDQLVDQMSFFIESFGEVAYDPDSIYREMEMCQNFAMNEDCTA